MRAAPIHDDYIRAALHNVADTTRSAHPVMKMPPRLRRDRTLLAMTGIAALITAAVALVLYVAARM